jgi:glycosyltransferase involved in cell wall biosynthesis
MPQDAMLMVPPRARTVTGGSGSATLRVLMVIDSLGPGGAERLLLDYLPRLGDLGVEARVCVLSERHGNPIANDLRRLGIPVDLVPVRRLADPAGALRVARYIRRAQPDVVHTQLQFADTIGAVAARLASRPVVSTLHTMSDTPPWSREALRVFVAERALGWASSRIVAVSDAARRFYETRTALPPAKLVTIHNGIDLRLFRERMAGRAEARLALGLPADAIAAVTVAVLRPEKGIESMLRALPGLRREHPRLTYLVVGEGPDRLRLEASAARVGVAEAVRFLGRREDVPFVLSACDLFVHPTLEDALPTSLMEAMAASLPIVASAVGGVPEMVEDGRNGRLVPPGQVSALEAACRELLASPEAMAVMGQAGERVVAERFDLDRQAARLRDLYLEVAGSRGR